MKLKAKDKIVISVCSLILLSSIIFLYVDFHTISDDPEGKEKQGFITFKYKVAQRKLSSKMVWENVEQMLPIYSLDSVRTDELSEAIVTLNNGIKIELDPDSMFVLNMQDKKLLIQIEKGSFYISTNGISKAEIKFNKANVQLENGQIKLTEKDDQLEVGLEKGKAKLEIGDSRKDIIEKEYFIIDTKNKDIKKTISIFNNLKPDHNTRVFTESVKQEIEFSFDTNLVSNFEIEFSKYISFKEIFFAEKLKTKKINLSFSEGIIYWRIKSNTGSDSVYSKINKFRVLRNIPTQLISPKNKEIIGSNIGAFAVNFFWTKKDLAIQYKLEISEQEDFRTLLHEKTLTRNSILIDLREGKYFWRVESSNNLAGSNQYSEKFQFAIKNLKENKESKTVSSEEFDEPAESTKDYRTSDIANFKKQNIVQLNKPFIVYPKNNSVIDMNKLDFIRFRWGQVAGAKSYQVKLENQNSETIFESSLTTTEFTFKELEKLDVGFFIFTIEAFPGDETLKAVSNSSRFTISLGVEPAPPEIISKGKKE